MWVINLVVFSSARKNNNFFGTTTLFTVLAQSFASRLTVQYGALLDDVGSSSVIAHTITDTFGTLISSIRQLTIVTVQSVLQPIVRHSDFTQLSCMRSSL